MSIDIKSLAIGFAKGRNSGKDPVLTELTVTENGVYDNPVIGGGLDFSVGKTLKFKDNITVDDFPDDFRWTGNSMPKATEFVYADSVTMTTVNIADYVAVMYEIWDTSGINCTKYVYTSHEELRQAMAAEVGIELPTTGWCVVYVEDFDPVSAESCEPPAVVITDDVISFGVSMAPSLFRVTSTPADGWNKVTVNVPIPEPCTHVPNMVPSDGSYVENIYFNTGLFGTDQDAPPDAMIAELAKIPEDCWVSGEEAPMGGEASYFFYVMSDGRAGYVVKNGISNISGGEFIYFICLTSTEYGEVYIEIAPTGEPDYPYVWGYCTVFEQRLPIGEDTLTEVPNTVVKVGTANHLLTNLISIRPFN